MRTLVAALLLTAPAVAADWPCFLGPTGDNHTPEKVAPWKGKLTEVWKKPVGEAHSSPVVADGIVYAFFTPKGTSKDVLAAFDAKTGDKKWEKGYERAKFTPPFGSGPRGTPCVSGGRVFTLGNTGVLACWDAKAGDINWKVDTLEKFEAKNLFFGVSTSPVVVGKVVIVMVGGKGAGIVGFDTESGKVAWQATDDPASYASGIVVGKDFVTLTGANVRAVGVADGKEKWAYPFKDKLNESSTTPVKAGDLYIASSVTAGTVALKVTAGKPALAWEDKKLTCYFSTPVVVGKHLYMVNGAANLLNPKIVLRCVDIATGKVLWEQKDIGKYHAAILRTGDDKLLLMDDGGKLTLFQPDDTAFKPLATAKLCGETWAHPAVSDGKLYIRDNNNLLCVKLPE